MTSDKLPNSINTTCDNNLGVKISTPAAALHVGGDAIVEEQLRVKDYVSSAGLRVSRYATGPFTTTPSMNRFADIDETRTNYQYCSNLGAYCSNAIDHLASTVRVKTEIPDVSKFVSTEQVVDIIENTVNKIIENKLRAYVTIDEAVERFVSQGLMKCYPTTAQIQGAFVRKTQLTNYVTYEDLTNVGLNLKDLRQER
jgi:hypothetical protein